LRIAEYHIRLRWLLTRNGPFHCLTIHPTAVARQCPQWVV
jgi:hypothetical protein